VFYNGAKLHLYGLKASPTMNRELSAYIDNAFAGTLSENTGVWSFQYDEAWVKQGYELSSECCTASDFSPLQRWL